MILDTTDRRLVEERGSRHSLIIRKVQPSDFGNYSCEADNKLGRTKRHMELSGKNFKELILEGNLFPYSLECVPVDLERLISFQHN